MLERLKAWVLDGDWEGRHPWRGALIGGVVVGIIAGPLQLGRGPSGNELTDGITGFSIGFFVLLAFNLWGATRR